MSRPVMGIVTGLAHGTATIATLAGTVRRPYHPRIASCGDIVKVLATVAIYARDFHEEEAQVRAVLAKLYGAAFGCPVKQKGH